MFVHYLINCISINFLPFTRLAERCPHFCELDIASCSNVTDVGIVRLAEGCPDLHSLDLSWCLNITDIGNLCHRIRILPSLLSICMYICIHMYIGLLWHIYIYIQLIFIYDNTHLGITKIAEGCPNDITDVSIVRIAEMCPSLQSSRTALILQIYV
jgi:hypothetical protein